MGIRAAFGIAASLLLASGFIIGVSDVVLAQQRLRVIVTKPVPRLSPDEIKRYRDEKVVTRVGIGLNERGRAVDYAALYTPYAQLSSIAYTDAQHLDPKTRCPDIKLLEMAGADNPRLAQLAEWTRRLNREGWKCLFGEVGPLPCKTAKCRRPIGGLQLQVWAMNDRKCRPVVVFRGTDFTDIGDWVSNFRWFNRLVPIDDQYDQVGDHIGSIVDKACRSRKAKVITAGHSLGGGLAQHAAFKERRVRYAYTFDPSPVTGFDLPRHDPYPDRKLGIDRVHEAGEILATPRLLIGGFIQPRNCVPYTRSVRFNTIFAGSPVAQHGIVEFTRQLDRRAPLGRAANADGNTAAQNCTVKPDPAL